MSVDERRIRDDLHAYADPAETHDVDGAVLRFRARLAAADRQRKARLRAVAVAATVLAVATAVTWRLATTSPDPVAPVGIPEGYAGPPCLRPGQVPQVPDPLYGEEQNFIAESASVDGGSGSQPCTLVLRYGFHRFGNDSFLSGRVWVFSDGRIMVDTDRDGFISWERRLTPEGVELVRSNAVAMLGEPVPKHPQLPHETSVFPIRYGDRLYEPRDPDQLVRQLDDLSWLPATAWQREQRARYVPTWYATCYESWTAAGRLAPHQVDPSAVLDRLPLRAQQVLRTKDITDTTPGSQGEPTIPCTVVDADEAQVVFDALSDAGVSGGETWLASHGYGIGTHDGRVQLNFYGLMPNGQVVSHGD